MCSKFQQLRSTHPGPGLPHGSTASVAAVKPEERPSTLPCCPSTGQRSADSPRWLVSFVFVSFPGFLESDVRHDCPIKPNRSSCVVCVNERRGSGVSLREEHQGPNLPLKPFPSDGPTLRRSDLGELVLAPSNCYRFPDTPTQILYTWAASHPVS